MNANLPQLQPSAFVVVVSLLNWWFACYIFSFAPTPCSNDDYHQIKGLHRNIAQTQTPAFAATLPYMQCNHHPVQNKCNGAYHSDNKLKRSNPFIAPTLKAKLLWQVRITGGFSLAIFHVFLSSRWRRALRLVIASGSFFAWFNASSRQRKLPSRFLSGCGVGWRCITRSLNSTGVHITPQQETLLHFYTEKL